MIKVAVIGTNIGWKMHVRALRAAGFDVTALVGLCSAFKSWIADRGYRNPTIVAGSTSRKDNPYHD